MQFGSQIFDRSPVHEPVLVIVSQIPQRFGQGLVEDQLPHRGFDLAVDAGYAQDGDGGAQVNLPVGVGDACLVDVVEHPAGPLGVRNQLGEVVAAHHHVQGGRNQRLTGGRRQHVVDAEHHRASLVYRHGGQRHVDGHLVAVEVGVERRTDQRVQLDGAALNQHRLEGLDAETVQRGRAVEHYRAVLDHVFENVPNLGGRAFHHALGGLDVGRQGVYHQAVHDEGLEEFQGHALGKAALVHLELRPNHDDRPAGVVHALAQQVLAEPSLLALKQVAQRLEGVVALALDGFALAAVVNQGVHGFLQHTLFVADHQARGAHAGEALEPVVAGQHPAVEVIEVAGGETSAVQLDHGPQFRREHRQHGHDHVLHPVFAAPEGFQQTHPLAGLGADLGRGGPHFQLGVVPFLVQVGVHELQKFQDGFRAHVGVERVAPERLEPVVAAGGKDGEAQPGRTAAGDVELVRQLHLVAGPGRQLQVVPNPIHIGATETLRRVPPQPPHGLNEVHGFFATLGERALQIVVDHADQVLRLDQFFAPDGDLFLALFLVGDLGNAGNAIFKPGDGLDVIAVRLQPFEQRSERGYVPPATFGVVFSAPVVPLADCFFDLYQGAMNRGQVVGQ